MVILVLPVQLDDVVIDILDRERHVNAVHADLLELQAGHGPGVVLQEHLVDPQADLVVRRLRVARCVGAQEFCGQRLSHPRTPSAAPASVQTCAQPWNDDIEQPFHGVGQRTAG